MRRSWAFFFSAALLTGCATSGPLGTQFLNASVKSNMARVVIYRVSASGIAIQPDYLVDGKAVASSQPGGFVACDVTPGKHQIAVGNFAISNNLWGEGSEKMSLDLRPGSVTYLLASPHTGLVAGQVTLTNVTEVQGRADIGELHQITAACTQV
jgi:Protein of unknown function (DUF2846)